MPNAQTQPLHTVQLAVADVSVPGHRAAHPCWILVLEHIDVCQEPGVVKKPVRYLGKAEFARRIGLGGPKSLDKYKLPTADVVIGEGKRPTRGWTEETVDTWNESRPGPGARTDLR